MSSVKVTVTVEGANGQSAEVYHEAEIRLGELISVRIAVTVAEAAALAVLRLR